MNLCKRFFFWARGRGGGVGCLVEKKSIGRKTILEYVFLVEIVSIYLYSA